MFRFLLNYQIIKVLIEDQCVDRFFNENIFKYNNN